MKTICIAIMLVPIFCFSQSDKTDKTQSKIEGISTKSGVLLKKSYLNIGKVKSVDFQVLEITDVTSKQRTKGLRIETAETGTYSSGSAVAFIDEDEIDGLINALQQFKELVLQSVPENDVEYIFTSRTGFTAFLYNYKKKWVFNIKVDKYKANSQPYWDGVGELEQMLTLLVDAKSKLN